MTRARCFVVGVICALSLLSARARPDQILAGQRVPDLPKLRWIKGTPFEHWEEGTTYVLVFTATWWVGDTMEKVISQVEGLTREFGQYDVRLRVVALAFHHTQFSIDASEFRRKWGPEISYDIALAHDGEGEQRLWAYLRTCGADAIPHIAVVDHEGRLAWTLGPGGDQIIPKMPLLTLVLEDVLAGEFDVLEEPGVLRRSGRKLPLLGDQLQRLKGELAVKRFACKWDEVLPILDEMRRVDPDNAHEYSLQKLDASLLAGRPAEEIYRLGLTVTRGAPDQKQALLALLSKVVQIACSNRKYLPLAKSFVRAAWPEPGKQPKDPEAIDTLIAKLNELSKERGPALWELLAALHRLKGDADAALDDQLKAYFLAADEGERARLRVGLREYKEESEQARRLAGSEPASAEGHR